MPSAPDQVDVNVTVKERATGNIQLGAGYSSTEGLVLTAGLAQQNLFGSGNALSLEINTEQGEPQPSRSPTPTRTSRSEGISRSVELFDRTSDLAELGLSSVGYSTRGLGVVYGVPFTEYDRVFFGLRWEKTTIDLTPFSPIRYVEYVRQFGETSDTLAFTTGWSRDNRDNLLVPQRGNYQRALRRGRPACARPAVLPAQLPVPAVLAAVQQGHAGHEHGDRLRRRLLAAIRTRSSRTSTSAASAACAATRAAASDRADIDGNPLGGNRRFNASFEALMPLPGADRTLRALAFFDMGQVWGQSVFCPDGSTPVFSPTTPVVCPTTGNPIYRNQKVDLGDLRYSVGIGIAWISRSVR